MNVYIDLTSDFLHWPTFVEPKFYTLSNGVQLIIPSIVHIIGLWADMFIGLYTTLYDINFWNKFFYYPLECVAFDAYLWMFELICSGLLNTYNHKITASLEDSLFQPNKYVVAFMNMYIFLLFFYLSLVYVYSYGLRNSLGTLALTEGGIFLYAYLDEIEEECGQLEDITTYVVYFLVFVLWFFFFNIFAGAIILKYINWLFALFLFIITLGLIVPSSLLTQIGLAFAQYIRGSGRSTSLIFETLLDFVSVSVIVIRFFVQNVRFVFIFVAFFEYYEYIDGKIHPLSNMLLPHITWRGYWLGEFKHWYWFEILLQIFIQTVQYIYFVGHLIITYIAQLSIYIILSFWIFFFLYTTFALPSKEKYFFFKRHGLLIK